MNAFFRIHFIQVFSAILIAGCCSNNERSHYGIAENILEAVPYRDGQQLLFRKSSGEEFTALVKRESIRQNFDVNDCAECCDDLENVELNITELTSTHPFIELPVIISTPDGSRLQNQSEPPIYLVNSRLILSIQKGDYSPFLNQPMPTEIKEIEIDNTLYNNVFRFPVDILTSYDAPNPYTRTDSLSIFYSKEKGVLKVMKFTFQTDGRTISQFDEYFLVQ
jgi:hypothetical protein